MRPIMLDMHGFAAFREPTRVDFADADFFALTGPTGSGKSTVIDAMTFALYGSVPRWGRKGMVSLALAPTVDRGTVKLVFEVGRTRYVAARELRRVGARVSQRAASLERLASADGLAEPGERTVPLAKDVDGVTEAVTALLGLSYEDFTQCVVLPQGDFQKFLHAKPADRQEILLRLLGAENYKQMMSLANQRAAAASLRAETIGETLRGYDDTTDEALAAAEAAEASLAELAASVAAAMPRIAAARSSLEAASGRLDSLRATRALLSGPEVPADAAAIDADLAAARSALADLAAAERAAEEADTHARDALAGGPKRTPLEVARDRRAERARIAASIPDSESSVAALSDRAAAAAAEVSAAEQALDRVRERRETAARAASKAAEEVTRLREEHAVLSSVTVPDGIAALDFERAAAAEALEAVDRELEAAETAEASAARARADIGPQAPLLRVLGDLDQLRDVLGNLADASRAVAAAQSSQASADQAAVAAEAAYRQRRDTLEEARRAHVIAGLRPHLEVGEACPLCEQTVTTLPGTPETMAAGKAARAAADEAERELKRAQGVASAAATATARAESGLESAVSRGNRLLSSLAETLTGPLAEAPLPATRKLAETRLTPQTPGDEAGASEARAEVAAVLKDAERVEWEAERAAQAANTARTRHRAAQAASAKAEAELATARQALSAARDPLVRFGAPSPDVLSSGTGSSGTGSSGTGSSGAGAPLALAWAALHEWARGQAAERAAGLAAAEEAERKAGAAREQTAAEFTAADSALATARQRAKAAEADEQQARAGLAQAAARLAELDRLLDGEPDSGEITRRLTLLGRLEAAADDAQRDLRKARAARIDGENAAAARESAARDARARLSAARDRIVSLGAPALDGSGSLVDGWTALVAWARAQAEARERDMARAAADADRARRETEALTGRLAADLAAAGIAVDSSTGDPATVADRAPALVAASREKARAAVTRITERRAEAAGLRSRQARAREEQRVAKLLGDLLRSNAFGRWLVTAALDELVAHASATLSDLSSGQFDLAYDDGDFYVIDHADADARRSVRTLSGGETFQASLALALALSSQISALSAAGAARLDSIFLDEGFGTLDPETLETVASTLETLAQGDRMVGVVTHVGALAERVPVRFRVSRNPRTSVVTREGPDLAMEDLAGSSENLWCWLPRVLGSSDLAVSACHVRLLFEPDPQARL